MKPILFNTEMVKAILNGKKTMTRRLIKFPKGTIGRLPEYRFVGKSPYVFYPCGIKHSKYKVGDVLYVREKFCTAYDGEAYFYFADRCTNREQYKLLNYYDAYWRPSIHMPKEAARIFLKVTNVRVERLQDISFIDALNEGIEPRITEYDGRLDHSEIAEAYSISCQKACIDAFHKLWDSTIKKSELDRYGWNANPWVFVYQFDRCEKPVGEVKE